MSAAPSTVASSWRSPSALLLVHVVALVMSAALHLALVAPYVAWSWVNLDLDTPGDEGPEDGPVGNSGGEPGELLSPLVPVQVSMYVERRPSKSKRSESAPVAATPEVSSSSDSSDGESSDAASEKPEVQHGDAKVLGTKGKPPRGKKKPCEPVEEIVQLADFRWRVERDMLDWYATHLRELDKQAGVGSHKGRDGKADGARLYLPRCSVLKQAGFKNGDIIRSVNGRRAYTIPQAVATYLAVRNDRVVTVVLTRKNGDELTHKYRLK